MNIVDANKEPKTFQVGDCLLLDFRLYQVVIAPRCDALGYWI